ncbi:DNA fragmentation factor subunit alpha-like [Daktulosphaira vitifoliae]|uniref:DNA fragmentation factor subunit alpha-like n=1 Tax=Daktulosphaira vitifoliae TaxID=58002 RepID=UPI0021A9876A|nr:DNA fragmentation factor subunit alpha-like [Daktulosphaira vitifoliae]
MANNKNFNKPYKIIDSRREHKIGVVANSLSELIIKAQQKLKINGPVKVVLEIDGTEIDENDYFETLEDNTLFMILKSEEKWCPYSAISIKIGDDHVDGTQNLYNLIERLKNDIGQITLLGGCDLELLSDMNLEDMENLGIDKSFLENIKEASGRYLSEKREAQDALNLLKLYHASTVKQNASKKNKV